MNIGLDIDGTIDAFPLLFQHLIAGWNANADHVYIITGISAPEATDADHAAKAEYLTGLGIPPTSYYSLVVIPHTSDMDHAEGKAQFIQDNKIDLLIDNNVDNCKAAKPYCAVFCLWNVKDKGDDGMTVVKHRAATKVCPKCQARIAWAAMKCPNCGEPVEHEDIEGLSNQNNDRLPIV